MNGAGTWIGRFVNRTLRSQSCAIGCLRSKRKLDMAMPSPRFLLELFEGFHISPPHGQTAPKTEAQTHRRRAPQTLSRNGARGRGVKESRRFRPGIQARCSKTSVPTRAELHLKYLAALSEALRQSVVRFSFKTIPGSIDRVANVIGRLKQNDIVGVENSAAP